MPSNNSHTAEPRTFVERSPLPATALDFRAAMRLAREIESHSTALRSWAGILLTRLNSSKPASEGTATMIRDIADAMEIEANIAGGLSRKLRQNTGGR
jgi:hypothetical protein